MSSPDTDYRLVIEGTEMDLMALVSLIGHGREHVNKLHAALGQEPVKVGEDLPMGQLLLEIRESAVDELPHLTHEEIEERLREKDTNVSVQLDQVGGQYE